jgi:hypothetical protein
MLNLPARLSGLFAAEADQAKIFTTFTKELRQTLITLTAKAPST